MTLVSTTIHGATPAPVPTRPAALHATGLTKRYGDALVLDGVDLEIPPGEVHALLGENGAGKSTLIKIVAGVVTPDAGRIRIAGAELTPGSPHAAQAIGVSTLFQELATVPGLSVAENVFLGRPLPARLGVVSRDVLEKEARALFATLGRREIDVRLDVERLSPVERTMTALARALSVDARLLILDEPTAALTDSETRELFATIRRLRERGVAILYVSHRLEEVVEIADRYTILRNGRRVADGSIAETTVPAVIAAMAGRPVDAVFPAWEPAPGPVLLAADGLRGRRIADISVALRAGEVVGIAGLAGSGRSELLRILGGASRARGGAMTLDGAAYAPGSPGAAQRRGVALVPQERRSQALVPGSAEENLNLSTIDAHALGSVVVSRGRERRHATELWEGIAVRGHGIDQQVLTLSGGNQQKVVLARFLATGPRVLLLDEPTRGVDVMTKAEIYRLIRDRAAAGCAVLVVSSELPELMGLCDRIVVLHEGRIAGRFDHGTATEEALLHVCYGRTA